MRHARTTTTFENSTFYWWYPTSWLVNTPRGDIALLGFFESTTDIKNIKILVEWLIQVLGLW